MYVVNSLFWIQIMKSYRTEHNLFHINIVLRFISAHHLGNISFMQFLLYSKTLRIESKIIIILSCVKKFLLGSSNLIWNSFGFPPVNACMP